MRPVRFELTGHRSVEDVAFRASHLNILFGKNNVGKTNILEAVYGALTGESIDHRRPVISRDSRPGGGLWVELEPGLEFDDNVISALSNEGLGASHPYARLGPRGVQTGDPEACAADARDSSAWEEAGPPDDHEDFVFDGLRSPVVPGPSAHVLYLDWEFQELHRRVEQFLERSPGEVPRDGMWLESLGPVEDGWAYRVPQRTTEMLAAVVALANDLLPDFIKGELHAHVTAASMWGRLPKVIIEFHERGATQCADVVELAGAGAARWLAASLQMALHLLGDDSHLRMLRPADRHRLSGHVVLLDEPEAHLHPSAVRSVTRWCKRMSSLGMTLLVATHHEEFLREADASATLIHVTRDVDLVGSVARALPSASATALRKLADDVGMHPAAALGLHRAVLFVEGPLDVAVLDEYGGLKLDAAGVLLVPVHGTKNLEGLLSAELAQHLGIQVGILTDATCVQTMRDRPNKKRSSEEKKLWRVLEIADKAGQPPPSLFGVPEADLLFALPREGIAEYRGGPYPEWHELVAECRAELEADASQSVNWKQYAAERYQVPLDTPEGVRHLVRHLDLRGAPMPSIDKVLEQVVRWAGRDGTETTSLGE